MASLKRSGVAGPAIIAIVALILSACGGGSKSNPPPPPTTESLFWEPRAYDLAFGDPGDTLFITNFEVSPYTWHTTHVPAGSTNLDHTVSIGPDSTIGMIWTWAPLDSGRVVDSLVATTTDPAHPRITIRFVRQPLRYLDSQPPIAPVLGQPDEGAVLHVGQHIEMIWTRVSDASGIRTYQLQIARDAQFRDVPFNVQVPFSAVTVEIESTDVGLPAWWRVRAQDKSRLVGPWSAVRTWTVER